jgi:NAD-dependent DNA ligase
MTTVERIDWLCRKLIIHSIIYYDYNTNIISDKEYDKCAKELEFLLNENNSIVSECYYHECLKDYSSATGFDLKYKLTEEHKKYLEHLAGWVLKLHGGEISNVEGGRK